MTTFSFISNLYHFKYTMAECFDEFDDATPLRNTFCTRLSLQEYEDQTANTTEEAIAQLMAHLDCNPQEYRKVLQAKKRDEANIFSYIKVFCVVIRIMYGTYLEHLL